MSTPFEIRKMVCDMMSVGKQHITEEEFAMLCNLALKPLPKEVHNGKECIFCSFKMGNARKTCPSCLKTCPKRLVMYNNVVVSTNTNVICNLCNGGCKEELLDSDANILDCNHRFCNTCMKNRLNGGFLTCPHCDRVVISESIRNKIIK